MTNKTPKQNKNRIFKYPIFHRTSFSKSKRLKGHKIKGHMPDIFNFIKKIVLN